MARWSQPGPTTAGPATRSASWAWPCMLDRSTPAPMRAAQARPGTSIAIAGGTAWEDCGAPTDCNAVSTLAVYDGDLYAGVSCYRAQGSSLPESPNRRPGGSVYRYAGGKEWVDCGQLGDAEDVFGLAVYDGELYGSAMYSAGMFKYAGGADLDTVRRPGHASRGVGRLPRWSLRYGLRRGRRLPL